MLLLEQSTIIVLLLQLSLKCLIGSLDPAPFSLNFLSNSECYYRIPDQVGRIWREYLGRVIWYRPGCHSGLLGRKELSLKSLLYHGLSGWSTCFLYCSLIKTMKVIFLSPLLALWLRQSLSSITARPSIATSQDPSQRTALCAGSDFFYVVTASICVGCYAV
jgi:hypothetical protein